MACTFNGGSGGWKILSCWRLSTPSGNVLMTCCAFQLRPHVVVTRTRFGPFDDELFDDDDDDDEDDDEGTSSSCQKTASTWRRWILFGFHTVRRIYYPNGSPKPKFCISIEKKWL